MSWLQFVIHIEQAQAERWADALLEAGAVSVQAEDDDADSVDERPLFAEPGEPALGFGWRRTRLTTLCDPTRLRDDDPTPLLRAAATALALAMPSIDRIETFADQDWVQATQAQFEPIVISARLIIAPSWRDPRVEADPSRVDAAPSLADAAPSRADTAPSRVDAAPSRADTAPSRVDTAPSRADAAPSRAGALPSTGATRSATVIIVDPGLAFGTGSHPTTRLCLEWIDEALAAWPAKAPPPTLIDYGCGSGILAIAATLLGAGAVRAIDIDPQAVATTRANALRNAAPLRAGLPHEIESTPAQWVVANILSNPLKLLAPMLSALVAPSGQLVLSGVLERQAEAVAEAYAGNITLKPWRSREGWTCLVGIKAGRHG